QKNVSITTYSSKYGGGDFSTGTSVNSECREVVEEIAAKNSSAGASIVKSLFDMIPDTVLVRSYDMMVGDILGFSSPEHDLIALNALIEEHPLSLFHEMAEYLVRAGLVSIRNTGGSLIILNKQGERIGQIELRNAAARQLAARAQGDPHYLIRAFQQEVFKDIDTDLTARIEMILLARDRLEKALGMIEAADPKLVSQLLSEADLDMETFIARILDNLLTGADNISYARGTRMLEFAASVLNVVMAEMETDVDRRKKLGILCGILFSIQPHDIPEKADEAASNEYVSVKMKLLKMFYEMEIYSVDSLSDIETTTSEPMMHVVVELIPSLLSIFPPNTDRFQTIRDITASIEVLRNNGFTDKDILRLSAFLSKTGNFPNGLAATEKFAKIVAISPSVIITIAESAGRDYVRALETLMITITTAQQERIPGQLVNSVKMEAVILSLAQKCKENSAFAFAILRILNTAKIATLDNPDEIVNFIQSFTGIMKSGDMTGAVGVLMDLVGLGKISSSNLKRALTFFSKIADGIENKNEVDAVFKRVRPFLRTIKDNGLDESLADLDFLEKVVIAYGMGITSSVFQPMEALAKACKAQGVKLDWLVGDNLVSVAEIARDFQLRSNDSDWTRVLARYLYSVRMTVDRGEYVADMLLVARALLNKSSHNPTETFNACVDGNNVRAFYDLFRALGKPSDMHNPFERIVKLLVASPGDLFGELKLSKRLVEEMRALDLHNKELVQIFERWLSGYDVTFKETAGSHLSFCLTVIEDLQSEKLNIDPAVIKHIVKRLAILSGDYKQNARKFYEALGAVSDISDILKEFRAYGLPVDSSISLSLIERIVDAAVSGKYFDAFGERIVEFLRIIGTNTRNDFGIFVNAVTDKDVHGIYHNVDRFISADAMKKAIELLAFLRTTCKEHRVLSLLRDALRQENPGDAAQVIMDGISALKVLKGFESETQLADDIDRLVISDHPYSLAKNMAGYYRFLRDNELPPEYMKFLFTMYFRCKDPDKLIRGFTSREDAVALERVVRFLVDGKGFSAATNVIGTIYNMQFDPQGFLHFASFLISLGIDRENLQLVVDAPSTELFEFILTVSGREDDLRKAIESIKRIAPDFDYLESLVASIVHGDNKIHEPLDLFLSRYQVHDVLSMVGTMSRDDVIVMLKHLAGQAQILIDVSAPEKPSFAAHRNALEGHYNYLYYCLPDNVDEMSAGYVDSFILLAQKGFIPFYSLNRQLQKASNAQAMIEKWKRYRLGEHRNFNPADEEKFFLEYQRFLENYVELNEKTGERRMFALSWFRDLMQQFNAAGQDSVDAKIKAELFYTS
ncbi:MAG: hypothetical protein PHS64_05705, partial [Candidatus Omnitrophica bacterium]|nr:hypothetical protein [Candidatus Omnitrophota bacterium]